MNRIVIKLSSSLIVRNGNIQNSWLKNLGILIQDLKAQDYDVWLVTSGAGAVYKLENNREVNDHKSYQSGQRSMFNLYRNTFSKIGLEVSEVLLSKDELKDRKKYLKIRERLEDLSNKDRIPLINEKEYINSKHTFSDNDEIAGLVASLVSADKVILATNVEGLLDNEGICLDKVEFGQKAWMKYIKEEISDIGRGGMLLKCKAAEHSANRGVDAVICDGRDINTLRRVIFGENRGTLFVADRRKKAKKRWIFDSKDFFTGEITVDQGLARVIKEGKPASILTVGISKISGDFLKKEVVAIKDKNSVIGYGEIRYDASDTRELIYKKEKKLLIHYNDYVRVI